MRVLLIEDNAADIELVREALKGAREPYELEVASDFEEARDLVRKIGTATAAPDVLLIDLNLPKGNGLELLRIFRAHPACASTPVIVISSSNSPKGPQPGGGIGRSAVFSE